MSETTLAECSNCKFSKFDSSSGYQTLYACMRYPPKSEIDDCGSVKITWPILRGSDWCGEFKPDAQTRLAQK